MLTGLDRRPKGFRWPVVVGFLFDDSSPMDPRKNGGVLRICAAERTT